MDILGTRRLRNLKGLGAQENENVQWLCVLPPEKFKNMKITKKMIYVFVFTFVLFFIAFYYVYPLFVDRGAYPNFFRFVITVSFASALFNTIFLRKYLSDNPKK